MNPQLLHIQQSHAATIYKAMQQRLSGHDQIIFDAMARVSPPGTFTPPGNPSQYGQKHTEIARRLAFRSALGGSDLFGELIDEVYEQASAGNLPAALIDDLLNLVTCDVNNEFKIRLVAGCRWASEWEVNFDDGKSQDTRWVTVYAYKRGWGQIVPWYVSQYIRGAISAYRNRSYAMALALLAIATEATLRDVLATLGYTRTTGPNNIVYSYASTPALVNVNSTGYTLMFSDPSLPPPQDLPAKVGGGMPITINLKRKVDLDTGRVDLVVTRPATELVDHWSLPHIADRSLRGIGGLGEAFRVARQIEHVIAPTDLPEDIDDVLLLVRNNLVHLSGAAMSEVLPRYAHLSLTGQFTLQDFINSPNLVYDFVVEIPLFVNDQYLKLRQNGHYMP